MKMRHFCSLALLAISAMFMIGCDKEEPVNPQTPDTPSTPTAKAPVAVFFSYGFSVTDSMAMVANFAIEYYDENGKLQTEQLSGTSWQKQVTAKLPAKVGTRVTASVKEGVDLTAIDVIKIVRTYHNKRYLIDEDGNRVGLEMPGGNTNTSYCTGVQLPDLLAKRAFLQSLYTYDAEGNETFHTEWE